MENNNHGRYGMKYDSKRRFASYWHQIREILERQPKNVLEIGVGSGFVSRYLHDRGIALTTVDNDINLHPDTVADVQKLPFEKNSYDVAVAYEVLEHIPYEDALEALRELCRVSKRYVILSVPDATRVFCFALSIPGIGIVRKVLSVPIFPRTHRMTKGGHYWEVGKQGLPLSRIMRDLEGSGFHIEKTYRVFENPYHRFFLLRKREA